MSEKYNIPKEKIDNLSQIQKNISNKVVKKNKIGIPKTVAGCDVSFSKENTAYSACVLLKYPELKKIKSQSIKVDLKFPYIPTYLAFRELKPILKTIEDIEADIYMIDSQGVAHPRRAGLASHLGVILDRATIGVAKSRLCGKVVSELDNKKGCYSHLNDDGEVIGAAVKTKADANPVYVSIGHKVSLKKAIQITLKTAQKYKVPEPIRLAHNLATKDMKKDQS